MADDIQAQLSEALAAYRPSANTLALIRDTPILLLVGISGAGKDSIVKELLKTGKYHVLVSYTTRPPRENGGVMEQDGVDYHFISLEQSLAMLAAGAYVEAKRYGGNIYGSNVEEIRAAHDAGKIGVTDLEVQGVAEYKAMDPNVFAVFVLPPDYDTWQARFMKRYGAKFDQAEIAKRMATAREELDHALATPYFSFVVNDDLAIAAAEVDAIVNGTASGTQTDTARQIAINIRNRLQAVDAAPTTTAA